MKSEIMVTVICYTYNQENYIKDALNGFISQKTNFKYEVIVHDDASTDGTIDILKEYAKKYPEIIKPIFEKENQYSKGVNLSFKLYNEANGKYIALCEGDDYWIDENKLQEQVDYLEQHSDCSFVFHNAEIIDIATGVKEKFIPANNVAKSYMKVDNNYNVAELELLEFIPTASFMFRQENVSKMPNWVYKMFVGDWPLKLVMTSFGYAHFIDKNMSVYRRNAIGSVTVKNMLKEKESIEKRKYILEKKKEILNNIDNFTEFKYHDVFDKKIIENEIEFLMNTNNRKEIIHKKYLTKFNYKTRIKYLIKMYFPHLSKIIINHNKKIRRIR